ncbi:MAG: hypothetical protein R3C52_09335 [Hyphomonadaceae bacterium]
MRLGISGMSLSGTGISGAARSLALAGAVALGLAACSAPSDTPAKEEATPAEAAAPVETPAAPAEPLENPLEAGSQSAKDDMYCSALLILANDVPESELSPSEMGKQMKAQIQGGALFEASAAKLVAEGATTYEQTADVSDAWFAVVTKDLADQTLKFTEEDCSARAVALPKQTP